MQPKLPHPRLVPSDMKWWWLSALTVLACREPASNGRAASPPTLKISLGSGYSATPTATGLDITRAQQVIGTLEAKGSLKNAAGSLESLITTNGGRDLIKGSSELYLGFNYLLSSDAGTRRAFLGLNSSSGSPVACASTSLATPEDLEQLAAMCGSVQLMKSE